MTIINSYVNVNTGSTPVIETLNVTPTTSAQQITAPQGTDGYSPVNVSAVTSSIDNNIQAGNIKSGVTILGVTGSYSGGGSDTTGWIVRQVDANGKVAQPTINASELGLSTIKDVGDRAFYYAYYQDAGLTGALDISSLTNVSGNDGMNNMFDECTGLTSVNLSSLTDVSGNYGMYNMFNGCTSLTSADLRSLTTISGTRAMDNMFNGCTLLTSVNLSSLTTISGQYGFSSVFKGCAWLTSVDLSSLTTISGEKGLMQTFYLLPTLTSVNLSSLTTVSGESALERAFMTSGLTGVLDFGSLREVIGRTAMQYTFSGSIYLTGVDFSSLETISDYRTMYYAFQNCTGLTDIEFSSLTTVDGNAPMQYMFTGCTGLTKISFYALDVNSFGTNTNQFNNMLSGVTGCTVYFPMRIQATIGSWASVTGGFGGTNTTVLFDIVTTLTGADTNLYTRKQKESTSTATAWTYNDTLYYTSGTTEPQVGGTIYSDAACTTAVTTIDAIA